MEKFSSDSPTCVQDSDTLSPSRGSLSVCCCCVHVCVFLSLCCLLQLKAVTTYPEAAATDDPCTEDSRYFSISLLSSTPGGPNTRKAAAIFAICRPNTFATPLQTGPSLWSAVPHEPRNVYRAVHYMCASVFLVCFSSIIIHQETRAHEAETVRLPPSPAICSFEARNHVRKICDGNKRVGLFFSAPGRQQQENKKNIFKERLILERRIW